MQFYFYINKNLLSLKVNYLADWDIVKMLVTRLAITSSEYKLLKYVRAVISSIFPATKVKLFVFILPALYLDDR